MRKSLFPWELAGFLFVLAAGALLHFTYDWSGGSHIVAAFSPVNESVWEHMKLLFFPLFLYSIAQIFFSQRSDFLAVRGLSALMGTLLIPVLFYTYTGIVGEHALWVDIAVFVVSAALTFLLDCRLLKGGRLSSGWLQLLGLFLLWGIAFLFVLFTFRTPQIPLFQDPASLTYGMPVS